MWQSVRNILNNILQKIINSLICFIRKVRNSYSSQRKGIWHFMLFMGSLVVVNLLLRSYYNNYAEGVAQDNFRYQDSLLDERKYVWVQRDSLKSLIDSISKKNVYKDAFTSNFNASPYSIRLGGKDGDSLKHLVRFREIFFNSNDTNVSQIEFPQDTNSYVKVDADMIFSIIQAASQSK